MAAKRVHFALEGRGRAICGSDQGRRRLARVVVTHDTAKVTCARCAKDMGGMIAFAEELAKRVGIAPEGGK